MDVEQRRTQVLDLSRPGAVGVEIEVAEAAEVLMSMAALLGYHGSGHHLVQPETIEAAARGDATAVAAFLGALAEYDVKHDAARKLLELDPTRLKVRLLELLPRWYEEVFVPHSDGWREAAERDADAKRKLARTHTPEQLVEL